MFFHLFMSPVLCLVFIFLWLGLQFLSLLLIPVLLSQYWDFWLRLVLSFIPYAVISVIGFLAVLFLFAFLFDFASYFMLWWYLLLVGVVVSLVPFILLFILLINFSITLGFYWPSSVVCGFGLFSSYFWNHWLSGYISGFVVFSMSANMSCACICNGFGMVGCLPSSFYCATSMDLNPGLVCSLSNSGIWDHFVGQVFGGFGHNAICCYWFLCTGGPSIVFLSYHPHSGSLFE